jgi:hypothetical protein
MTADNKPLTLANMVGMDLKIAMLALAILIIVIWAVLAMRNKSADVRVLVAGPNHSAKPFSRRAGTGCPQASLSA